MFSKVKHSNLLRYRHILGDKKVLDPLRVETELQRNSLKLLVKPTKLQNGTTTFSIMTFSVMTFSIMTFSVMTFSVMTFSIMTLSIMTLSIMTFSITAFSI